MAKQEIRYNITAKNRTRKVFKDIRNSVNSIGRASIIAGTAVAAGLTAAYAKTAKEVDKLAKTSRNIDFNIKDFAALRHQAQLSGVSMQMLDSSILRLNKRLGEAKKGFGAANKELKSLGLNNEKFFSLSLSQQYQVITQRISEMSTAQEKAAATAAFFGREGLNLVEMFRSGADGFRKAREEVEEFGVALSAVSAAKIEKANDQVFRLSQMFKGLSRQLTVKISPIISGIAQKLIDWVKNLGGVEVIADKISEKVKAGFVIFNNNLRHMKTGVLVIKQGFLEIAGVIARIANTVNQSSTLRSIFGIETKKQIVRGKRGRISRKIVPNETISDISEKIEELVKKGRKDIEESIENPSDPFDFEKMLAEFQEQYGNFKKTVEGSKPPETPKPPKLPRFEKTEENKASTSKPDISVEFEQIRKSLLTEEQLIRESHDRRKMIIAQAHNDGLINQKRFHDLLEKNEQERNEKLRELETQQKTQLLGGYKDIFDGISQILSVAGAEQSKAYRAMFAASKAFAINEAIIKIQQGIANAASLGWPKNIPAIAGIVSSTAGVLATIKGTSLPSFEGGGFTGHGARVGGLDGKGGMLAMVHKDETVIDHKKGGSLGDHVEVHVHVNTGVQQTVRGEIVSLMPQIKQMATDAVIEAKTRGGNMANTFGGG